MIILDLDYNNRSYLKLQLGKKYVYEGCEFNTDTQTYSVAFKELD